MAWWGRGNRHTTQILSMTFDSFFFSASRGVSLQLCDCMDRTYYLQKNDKPSAQKRAQKHHPRNANRSHDEAGAMLIESPSSYQENMRRMCGWSKFCKIFASQSAANKARYQQSAAVPCTASNFRRSSSHPSGRTTDLRTLLCPVAWQRKANHPGHW